MDSSVEKIVSWQQKNFRRARSERRTNDRRFPTGRLAVITETTTTNERDPNSVEREARALHLLVMSPQVLFSKELPPSGFVTIGRSSRCDTQIEDPMASREHARIHIKQGDGAPSLLVEDVGSANGTLVNERALLRGRRVPLSPGDAMSIGSTVIIFLQGRPPVSARRVWSRKYFDHRVAEECARGLRANASFALSRIRFNRGVLWTRVVPVVARWLPSPHVFAAGGPRDYDALLVDVDGNEVARLMADLVEACRESGMEAEVASAHFPEHGRFPGELLAHLQMALPPAQDRLEGSPQPSDPTGRPRPHADPDTSPEMHRSEATLTALPRGDVDDETDG